MQKARPRRSVEGCDSNGFERCAQTARGGRPAIAVESEARHSGAQMCAAREHPGATPNLYYGLEVDLLARALREHTQKNSTDRLGSCIKAMATTQLHLAARDGNVERVQEIIEGRNGQVKVSINTQNAIGQTPIHLAAKWGRLDVMKFLIEAGADLEIKDRKGRTPLYEADESIVQTHLTRHSQRLRMTMDVSKMSMANATYDLKQQRRGGDITDGSRCAQTQPRTHKLDGAHFVS